MSFLPRHDLARLAPAYNLRPRSFERYEGIVRRYLVPELASVKLGRLHTRHIADVYASLRLPRSVTITHARSVRTVERAMSAASLRYLHAVLHSALSQAVEWRIIAGNPADRIRLPAKTGAVMTPLAPDQVPTFLKAIRDHPLEGVFTLAIATCMRQGEILGLQWRDLDGSRLHVRHTVVRMNGGWWLGDPKTARRVGTHQRFMLAAQLRHLAELDALIAEVSAEIEARRATTIATMLCAAPANAARESTRQRKHARGRHGPPVPTD